jgi:hypothetical protein
MSFTALPNFVTVETSSQNINTVGATDSSASAHTYIRFNKCIYNALLHIYSVHSACISVKMCLSHHHNINNLTPQCAP